jgi:membrane-bound lytic murein transglycosylase A
MLVPNSLDPVAKGHAMPLPDARPSEKIAKLFPQTDPLKNKDGAKPPEPASVNPAARNVAATKDTAAAAAQGAKAQLPVAEAVPLPEARPAIEPSRPARRHRYHRRYRNAR